jgi:YD repeat-containing protein
MVALDSRRALPDNGTGVRIEGHGDTTVAPGANRRGWVGYGAAAGVAIDFGAIACWGSACRPISSISRRGERLALGWDRAPRIVSS